MNIKKRRIINSIMNYLFTLAALSAVLILGLILGYVVLQGVPALNIQLFTELPKPVGEAGGGIANSIVGTIYLIAIASLIGIPIGVLSGLYLAEYGRNKRFGEVIRFVADVLSGIPSIVIGIFVYTLIVLAMGGFSALAGGVALGILMIPTITRSTDEVLKLVPNSIREAALGLGASRRRTALTVILPAGLSGIFTGIILAIARVAGETAPLLFTALGNRFWSAALDRPIAAIPLQIFTYATSPYKDWHAKAWAGSLVLILMILILSLLARFITGRGRFGHFNIGN